MEPLVDVRRSTFLRFPPAILLHPSHPSHQLPPKFSMSSLFTDVGSPSVGSLLLVPFFRFACLFFSLSAENFFRGKQTGLNRCERSMSLKLEMNGRKKEISNVSFEAFNFEKLSLIPVPSKVRLAFLLPHLDNGRCDG